MMDVHRGRVAVVIIYPVAALILVEEVWLRPELPAECPHNRSAKTSESVLPRVGAFSLFALPVPSTINR